MLGARERAGRTRARGRELALEAVRVVRAALHLEVEAARDVLLLPRRVGLARRVLGLQRAAALEQRALLEHLEAAPLAEAALELPEEVPVLLHFQWTEQGW